MLGRGLLRSTPMHRNLSRTAPTSFGRFLSVTLIAGLLAASGREVSAAAPSQDEHPSLLVVVLDDVGQEPLGHRWSATPPLMPSLASMAKTGMVFTRAYAWPTCSPSRLALLSGVYPRRAGAIRDFGSAAQRRVGIGDISLDPHQLGADRLPLELELLPEALSSTHETLLVGKWHLGRPALAGAMNLVQGAPNAQGFAHWLAGNPTAPSAGNGALGTATGHYNWYRVEDGLMTREDEAYATDVQRGALLAWWKSTPGPKFAVLSTSLAHAPFDAPPGYADRPTMRGDYEQGLAYLDVVLADVFAAVDTAQDFLFVTSDNGCPDVARPAGMPAERWKASTYEGGIRVPLVVMGPGVAVGQTDRLVSHVDLAATVLEMLGAPRGSSFQDSLSFADELGAAWIGAPERTFVLSERYDVTSTAEGFPVGYDDTAIIGKLWKYRVWDPDGSGPGGFVEELYHLATDPFELLPRTPAQVPGIHQLRRADLQSLPPRMTL